MPRVPHYWGNVTKREKFGEIKGLDELATLMANNSFTCGNVQWKFGVENREDKLWLVLRCLKGPTYKNWSIITSVDYSSMKNDKPVGGIQTATGTFDKRCKQIDLLFNGKTISDDLLDGSILDIQLSLRVTEANEISFDSCEFNNRDLADVVLKINNREFFMSKLLLVMHCDYFKAMFQHGRFKEATQKDIPLQDNEYDVQNFLELVTGMKEIDDDSVEGIVEISQKWQAHGVLRQCEHFLTKHSEKSYNTLYEISLKYNINDLEIEALSRVHTLAQAIELRDQYPGLPVEKKRLLMAVVAEMQDGERESMEAPETPHEVIVLNQTPEPPPEVIDLRTPSPVQNPIEMPNIVGPYPGDNPMQPPAPWWVLLEADAAWNNRMQVQNMAPYQNQMFGMNPMMAFNPIPAGHPRFDQAPWMNPAQGMPQPNQVPQVHPMAPQPMQQAYYAPVHMNMMVAAMPQGNPIYQPHHVAPPNGWHQF